MKHDLEIETEMSVQDLLVNLRKLKEMPMNYLRRERGCLMLAEGLLHDLNTMIKESRAA